MAASLLAAFLVLRWYLLWKTCRPILISRSQGRAGQRIFKTRRCQIAAARLVELPK